MNHPMFFCALTSVPAGVEWPWTKYAVYDSVSDVLISESVASSVYEMSPWLLSFWYIALELVLRSELSKTRMLFGFVVCRWMVNL